MLSSPSPRSYLHRRAFLRGLALLGPALLIACDDDERGRPASPDVTQTSAATAGSALPAGTTTLAPTPACDSPGLTVAQTEGPFFKPSSPRRTNLVEAGVSGTLLTLTGVVLMTDCRPVAGALLDFWQADDRGAYDNTGFRLRGHQFADDQGRFTLSTVVPALYPGRTRHIHVKVQAPNRPALTTQLYFPNEAGNASDGIFNRALVMDVRQASAGQAGQFRFVLEKS